jgi:hypothetical protein
MEILINQIVMGVFAGINFMIPKLHTTFFPMESIIPLGRLRFTPVRSSILFLHCLTPEA